MHAPIDLRKQLVLWTILALGSTVCAVVLAGPLSLASVAVAALLAGAILHWGQRMSWAGIALVGIGFASSIPLYNRGPLSMLATAVAAYLAGALVLLLAVIRRSRRSARPTPRVSL